MEQLRFEDLNLSKELRKAVENMGFEEATPIQSAAIPIILEGKDIIGQAQTGTGKTVAFGIPILEVIQPKVRRPQAIILCPTRELAIQVADEFKKLSKYKKDVSVLPIYGGQPIDRQVYGLKKGVQIIIGTPGRTIDHIRRGNLKLDHIKVVVLDEADEMLDMGFIDDIETILSETPQGRQTLLFSATMPKPILDLTKRYQKDPQLAKVVHKQLTVPNVEQVYFEVKESMKLEALSRLIDIHDLKLSLVFCNTKRRVDEVVANLQVRGYLADGLHGDMTQAQRDRVMGKFRSNAFEILVATDVAARGIDVDGIEAVFNYDLPQNEEYYVHRIGRTARMGKAGRAFTFAVGKEIYKLREIQAYANVKIERQKVPSVNDVEEIRLNSFLDKVKEQVETGGLEHYTNLIERLIDQDYASVDIAAALLKLSMGEDSGAQAEDFDGHVKEEMARLFVSIGRNQKIDVKDVLGAIAGETGIPGKRIGKIEIYDKYTFVEVPKKFAEDVLNIMNNNQIKGIKIGMEWANKK
ncbi:MAG: DEAD/DEAH box helicase [Syntrophobacterales bacterium]|jgi:ATP-dependent RNA helicase DeaD|nr:DEAD/DEAH box helicase [Syntrophobacterales bacterium]